ncbi:unnamed protein product, partial [Durusdinium trenchii]
MHGSFPCAEETCLCKFHVPPLKKRKDLGGSDVSRQNDKQINNKRSYMSPYVPTPYHVYAACIQFAYIVRKSPTTSPPTHNHHNPFRQHECLILIRPNSDGDRGRCSAYVVVRLCEDRFANWAREHFSLVLSSARRTALAYLNRPGVVQLREQDRRFYVIISLQSFKRGMPLLPAYKTEPSLTEIDAGTPYGLRRWLRYELSSSSKFHLADYLKVFLRRLGVEIEAY